MEAMTHLRLVQATLGVDTYTTLCRSSTNVCRALGGSWSRRTRGSMPAVDSGAGRIWYAVHRGIRGHPPADAPVGPARHPGQAPSTAGRLITTSYDAPSPHAGTHWCRLPRVPPPLRPRTRESRSRSPPVASLWQHTARGRKCLTHVVNLARSRCTPAGHNQGPDLAPSPKRGPPCPPPVFDARPCAPTAAHAFRWSAIAGCTCTTRAAPSTSFLARTGRAVPAVFCGSH